MAYMSWTMKKTRINQSHTNSSALQVAKPHRNNLWAEPRKLDIEHWTRNQFDVFCFLVMDFPNSPLLISKMIYLGAAPEVPRSAISILEYLPVGFIVVLSDSH